MHFLLHTGPFAGRALRRETPRVLSLMCPLCVRVSSSNEATSLTPWWPRMTSDLLAAALPGRSGRMAWLETLPRCRARPQDSAFRESA